MLKRISRVYRSATMLVIEKKYLIFKVKEVHFADYPFDVKGCDSVTFSFCRNKVGAEEFTRVESPTLIIDLTQDLDTIWRNMDRKSTRYAIKRAQRDRIKFKKNEDYDEFYRINRSLQQKKGAGSLFGIGSPKLETMERYGTLFTAEAADEILGGHLYLEDKNSIKLWLSASKRLEVEREKATLIGNANRLLHWEAMKYAKEKGIEEFDWGGLWSEEEADKDKKKKAINSFKLSFGGERTTRYSYQKVYSKAYRFAQHLYALFSKS